MSIAIGNNGKDIYKIALIKLDGADEAKRTFEERMNEDGGEEESDGSAERAEIVALLKRVVGGKAGQIDKDNPSSALVLMAASAFLRTVSLPYAASEMMNLLKALSVIDNDARALEKYALVRDDDMPDMTEELALTKKLREAVKGMVEVCDEIKAYVERKKEE